MEVTDKGKPLGTYDMIKITAVKSFIIQAPKLCKSIAYFEKSKQVKKLFL
jgi:hypothetical protein